MSFFKRFFNFYFRRRYRYRFYCPFFRIGSLVRFIGLKEVLSLDIPDLPASDIETRLTFIAAMEKLFFGAKSGKKVKTAKKIKWHTVETEINKINVPVLSPPRWDISVRAYVVLFTIFKNRMILAFLKMGHG